MILWPHRRAVAHGGDHSRRITKAWLAGRGHDADTVFAWLDTQGGFCDCEILANVEQEVDEAKKASRRHRPNHAIARGSVVAAFAENRSNELKIWWKRRESKSTGTPTKPSACCTFKSLVSRVIRPSPP